MATYNENEGKNREDEFPFWKIVLAIFFVICWATLTSMFDLRTTKPLSQREAENLKSFVEAKNWLECDKSEWKKLIDDPINGKRLTIMDIHRANREWDKCREVGSKNKRDKAT